MEVAIRAWHVTIHGAGDFSGSPTSASTCISEHFEHTVRQIEMVSRAHGRLGHSSCGQSKLKKTRKFAEVKRMIKPSDPRL